MKTKGKAWQLVLSVVLIAAFVYTAFFGVAVKYGDVTTTYLKGAKDIRFGVDIKGGVNVTFVPSDGYDATDEQLAAAQLVIENRLVALNITDYELYVDTNADSLILEFPWQSGETDFDPEAAIQEIGTTAYLTFREGSSADGELILDGSEVQSAAAQYGPVSGSSSEYYVALTFTDEGAKAFGDATTKLYQSGGTISIWLDDENVSTATVNAAITDGKAIITSSASDPFTQDAVVKMARQINSGSLPFALSVDSYSTISPSLGENSLAAMVLAGLIAFALIVVLMTALYRLPGFLACLALAGQVAATLAFVSGYFPVFESFTLTLPGIAGIILAIGMGVDANVITAERIRRRRECLRCHMRFTTYEIVETVPLIVIKKDNSREPFDRQKLLNAMLRACAKRPVSYETLERAVSSIEQTLMSSYDREVTSVRIGELTMQELKRIDEVAYVRFASVYQQFADVESFFNELKKLMGSRKEKP